MDFASLFFFSTVVLIDEYAETAMKKILLELKPCNLIMYLTKLQGILPQSCTFPYTKFCLHTLLRQTYARNPRFFFSFRLPYALLSLVKTVTPFNYTAQATGIEVKQATARFNDFFIGWFGENPETMKTIVGSKITRFYRG
ncbi:hypothetical protein HID58_081888 [Brassica napus]|uniref:Uncharacterized protein n=1 Tax=Brassica napus TaxID=3708 RepID=A0ABQ7Y934_BRANA|nr:hypothetical protein HID58_081888 [Brassica napus]